MATPSMAIEHITAPPLTGTVFKSSTWASPRQREAHHDAELYGVYKDAATHLQNRGARNHRVVLDYELKREYQQFLQAHNRGRRKSSGRPDRSLEEIAVWAAEHHLPIDDDGHVQFPDVRIEYEHPDGRFHREDLELTTDHYNSRPQDGGFEWRYNLDGTESHQGVPLPKFGVYHEQIPA